MADPDSLPRIHGTVEFQGRNYDIVAARWSDDRSEQVMWLNVVDVTGAPAGTVVIRIALGSIREMTRR